MATVAALTSPVHATDYYAGKTITFIVGTDTGGGFSIYARAIAKHRVRRRAHRPLMRAHEALEVHARQRLTTIG